MTLPWSEGLEQPILIGEMARDELVDESASGGGEGDRPGAAIGGRRVATNETLSLEPVDPLGCGSRGDQHRVGKLARSQRAGAPRTPQCGQQVEVAQPETRRPERRSQQRVVGGGEPHDPSDDEQWSRVEVGPLPRPSVGDPGNLVVGVHLGSIPSMEAIVASMETKSARADRPATQRLVEGPAAGHGAGDPRRPAVMTAKDLAVEDPRGLDAELEGYAWLPRMLDKARATLAGTPGRYQFGCPVDHTCMARLGVEPELVLELAGRHADDHAVLDELHARGIPSAAQAWFDGQAVEDELQQTGNYLRVRNRDALPTGDAGAIFAGAEHGAGVSVVLIDAPADHAQEPHTHPVEEVVVLHEGAATFFLGDRQARIVCAGEIVRIPARVPHRWIAQPGNTGLRGVAAYGADHVITHPAQ